MKYIWHICGPHQTARTISEIILPRSSRERGKSARRLTLSTWPNRSVISSEQRSRNHFWNSMDHWRSVWQLIKLHESQFYSGDHPDPWQQGLHYYKSGDHDGSAARAVMAPWTSSSESWVQVQNLTFYVLLASEAGRRKFFCPIFFSANKHLTQLFSDCFSADKLQNCKIQKKVGWLNTYWRVKRSMGK